MAVFPFGAPSLPTSVSTHATFLPSGEMAACSNRCVAKSVFTASSNGPTTRGFSPAFNRTSTACALFPFSCAQIPPAPSIEQNRVAAKVTFRAKTILFICPFLNPFIRQYDNPPLTRPQAQSLRPEFCHPFLTLCARLEYTDSFENSR